MIFFRLFSGLSLLILLNAGINAQSPYFERFYDTGVDDGGVSLNPLPDGRLLVAGYRRRGSGTSTTQGFYMMLAADGTTENIFYQDTPLRNGINRALSLPNGRTLLAGYITSPNSATYDDWVFNIVDENGAVTTVKSYGELNLDEELDEIIRLQDGRLLASGGEGRNNNAYVTLFDENIDVAWSRTFSAPGTRFNRFTAAAEIPNGFIFSGHSSQPTSPVWETIVARYDQDGNLIWSNKYTRSGMQHLVRNQILPTADGVLIFDESIIGSEQSITMLHLDYNGAVVNYVAFQRNGTKETLRDVIRLQNGNILLCGYAENGNNLTRGFLKEIRDDGSVLWSRSYRTEADMFLFKVAERTDGLQGFYAIGRSRGCLSDDDDIYLLALDGNGLGASGCDVMGQSFTPEGRSIEISSHGQSATHTATEGLRAPMTAGSVTSARTSCVILYVDGDLSSGSTSPFQFRGREDCNIDSARVVDTDTSFDLSTNYVDSIVLVLSADPVMQNDWLFYSGPLSSLIRGQNTSRLTILNDGTLIREQMAALLGDVVLRNPTETEGMRTVDIIAYAGCEESPQTTSTFNALGVTNLEIDLPDTLSVCAGDPVLADAGIDGFATYRWSNGDTTRASSLAEEGTYFVTVSNSCTVAIDTVTVTITSAELIAPEDQVLMLCLGDSSVVDFTVVGADTYTVDGRPSAPENVFRAAGTYELMAINSCDTVQSSVRVTTEDCCQIYLPTAFSPNGDGINDVFRAFPDTDKCGLVTDYQLRIFDRWGGEVFAGEVLTAGWNGRINGEAAGNGHYVFSMSYFNGIEQVSRSGGLVLLY